MFAGKTTQQTICKNQIKQQQEPNAENANASYTLQARQKFSLPNKERIDSHILANYETSKQNICFFRFNIMVLDLDISFPMTRIA